MSNFASEFTPIAISTAKDKISSSWISLFYLLDVLLVHIVNFLNLNYQMLLVIQILLFSILIVKIVKNLEDIQALRKRYGIATVPALFVSENGTAKVVCDSSLSEDDILDFIS